MKKRLLVTGGSGYVGGWILRKASAEWNLFATFHRHPQQGQGVVWRSLDLRDPQSVHSLVEEIQPHAIIHAAALNPGQGSAFDAVNAEGTRQMARAAEACGSRLVHVSTDMVFDGEKGGYKEEDPVSPLTDYGKSKARAEEAVLNSAAEAVIVRTSLVYGWKPELSRSVQWILDDLAAGKRVDLFTDERRCPIWVESLAEALLELLQLSTTGVLHVAGAQILSRYEFGVRMLPLAGVDLDRIGSASSREMGLKRPLECTLDSSLARRFLKTPLPGMDQVLPRSVT